MTLNNFLTTYGDTSMTGDFFGGNDLISIEGYCEEELQECVMKATWYKNIKNKTVKKWQTIGGGGYPIVIWIELKGE